MTTKYKMFGIAVLTVLTVACGENKQASPSSGHADHQDSANSATTPQASTGAIQLKDDKLSAVYQHYTHLTTALVKEDAAEARIAANAIEAGAKQVDGGNALAASASKISASSDIEQQRSAFSKLSDEMISLVKKSGVTSGEVYVDYCPMAMNDKGAFWLSNNKEIRNPYFGDKMLTCGEVKETIK